MKFGAVNTKVEATQMLVGLVSFVTVASFWWCHDRSPRNDSRYHRGRLTSTNGAHRLKTIYGATHSQE